jgi:hypothetical protein
LGVQTYVFPHKYLLVFLWVGLIFEPCMSST